MKTKTILSLGLYVILSVFSSCSQDDDLMNSTSAQTDTFSLPEIQQAKELAIPINELRNLSEEVKQKRAASITLSDYIVLDGNQYRLEISEQDAQKLGVTPYFYDIINKDILATNTAIMEMLEKGEYIELCDVQAVSKAYKKGELDLSDTSDKYSRATYPSGNITTLGQEEGKASFKTEYDHTKVLFRCRTNATATPIYCCTVTAFGVKKIGSKIGNLITTTEITVPIAASGSGIYADLTFATTDSNGGYCYWKAQ